MGAIGRGDAVLTGVKVDMCQAIGVRRNRVEQCSDEAVFDDLCVFHYILARRVTERHLRVLQVGKAKDKATILEFKEVEK